MQEDMDMRGQLRLMLHNRTGKLVYDEQYRNKIVTSGRELVARIFTNQADGRLIAPVSHMAVGTGTIAPSDGDIELGNERAGRTALTVENFDTQVAKGAERVRVELRAVFDFDAVNDAAVPLTEAGIFNADSGGVMYNRVTFPGVTKTNAFKLTLIWNITF